MLYYWCRKLLYFWPNKCLFSLYPLKALHIFCDIVRNQSSLLVYLNICITEQTCNVFELKSSKLRENNRIKNTLVTQVVCVQMSWIPELSWGFEFNSNNNLSTALHCSLPSKFYAYNYFEQLQIVSSIIINK